MRLKEIFIISRGTKVILAITFSVTFAALLFAFFHYRSINNTEDPRIIKAREYLAEYDRITDGLPDFNAFNLLDSANAVFLSYPDYRSSFEPGVIYNNKCSALLLMALYDSTLFPSEKEQLLSVSMKYCDSSIASYSNWIREWGSLSMEDISLKITPLVDRDDPAFRNTNFNRILTRRIENILSAQIETPRRLSVSLSNKGTIYRHLLKPDSSLLCYNESLALWKDNHTAKSNLSVLMGGEPVKQTIIQSLFPPDKNKK